jgi:hypothetical protein
MLRNLFDNLAENWGGAGVVIVALLGIVAIAVVWIVFRLRQNKKRK